MSGHLTPTAHAEEFYQAKLDRKFDRAMKKGPAGILIPPARQLYRKTVDGPLLSQIIAVAYASWRKAILSPARWEAVGQSLRADLLRRFPAEDMAVLERYACAAPRDRAHVEILAGDYEAPQLVMLPVATLAPGAAHFHVDLGGRGTSSAPPVPADTVEFFRDVVRTRKEKHRSFDSAAQWVSIYRVKEGRFPLWQEIERQFPMLGDWIEGQRR